MLGATTRVSTWRGKADDDEFGDEVDVPMTLGTEHVRDKPASVFEKSRRDYNAETQQWRTVRYFVVEISGAHDVADGDRVKDLRTGRVFIVDGRTEQPSISGFSSVVFALRATSTP